MSSSSTSRRSDSIANRARIVAAARVEVTSQAELNLHGIARRAGVGQGTLYRHFPTRDALLAAVYEQEVEDLVSAAASLLAAGPPEAALRAWLERVAEYAAVKRGVIAAVEAALWRDLTTNSLGPIGDAIATLLEAGRRAGAIRPDADAQDVILLLGALTRIDDAEYDTRSVRLVTLIMDGLRAGR